MSASRSASKIKTPINNTLITSYFGQSASKEIEIASEKENTNTDLYDKFVGEYAHTCEPTKNCHQMKAKLREKLKSLELKLASIQKARSTCLKICEKKDATILTFDRKLKRNQSHEILPQPEVMVSQEHKKLAQSKIKKKPPQFSGLIDVLNDDQLGFLRSISKTSRGDSNLYCTAFVTCIQAIWNVFRLKRPNQYHQAK